MATLTDLFKQNKKEVYGTVGNIYIESRGFINPPRAAALLASSPTAIGDLIGQNVAGVIKGSANRPSDTIFNNKTFISKPKSLTAPTTAQLRDMIESGEKYFVKKNLQPNVVGAFLQGASNPAGAAANLASKALNSYGSVQKIKNFKKFTKELRDGIASSPENPSQYGTKFMPDTKFGNKHLAEDKIFSEYEPVYTQYTDKNGQNAYGQTDIVKRDKTKNWNLEGLDDRFSIEERNAKQEEKKLNKKGQVYVLFKKEGDSFYVPFAGLLTGISEDVQPEWTDFRYIGSPFKVHKYIGVERSLKFELKMHYSNPTEKDIMIQKINYLKSLAFPFETISEITYENGSTNQYAFSPNFVYLTIGDLYKNIFGHIESISFNIEDNVAWPSLMGQDDEDTIYPSVVNVSISMKIIENHKTVPDKPNGITKYKYDFDGKIEYNKKESIEPAKIERKSTKPPTVPRTLKAAAVPNVTIRK